MVTINKSLAAGIRKSNARDMIQEIRDRGNALLKASKAHQFSYEVGLRRMDMLCAIRRRRPNAGARAGNDLLFVDYDSSDSMLLFKYEEVDKRGRPIKKDSDRVLMAVSQHATESLYQRLRTFEWADVIGELRPVGAWLLENLHTVVMEKEGYLVTPTGVFPVVRGYKDAVYQVDDVPNWLATTWISQANLEDHTPHKRRVAEAVRAVSGKGVQFVKI